MGAVAATSAVGADAAEAAQPASKQAKAASATSGALKGAAHVCDLLMIPPESDERSQVPAYQP